MNHLLPYRCLCDCLGAGASGAPDGAQQPDFDAAVRPQDDFFRHVNGRWLAATPIPADRSRVGAFETLIDETTGKLRALVEAPEAPRRIADLYASFMDEARIESLGLAPLAGELARVDAITAPRELAALFARLAHLDAGGPLLIHVGQDARDTTRYVPTLYQAGLGLPDRDFYLDQVDANFARLRAEYREHLARLFALAGLPDDGEAVLSIETALAEAQWSRTDSRDALRTYNRVALDALPAPLDWAAFLAESGLAGRTPDVIVAQPSFAAALGRLVAELPLAHWKAYAKARLLTAYAPFLGREFVDEGFAFAGRALRGTPTNLPRWERGVRLVDASLGEELGRMYVERWLPPAARARMAALVGHLMRAYRDSLEHLGWMGETTRAEAEAKLDAFGLKIGAPAHWIDYAALDIRRDDLVGNLIRARAFERERQLARLGRPVDRDEWPMSPQTVNACYDPTMNEIVFPAAILQPPFFDLAADDALNYGAIGSVIGHEISHGFDDQGSRYDARGNLRDWWAAEDRARFTALAEALVAQYGRYEPLAGYRIDGRQTLGENIADNAGLAIAYKAWRLSLGGAEPPVAGGLSGAQRFFAGFARIWRSKWRDERLIEQLKAGVHSPGEFRTNGTLRNQHGFHAAFDVREGDAMHLAPESRVTVW